MLATQHLSYLRQWGGMSCARQDNLIPTLANIFRHILGGFVDCSCSMGFLFLILLNYKDKGTLIYTPAPKTQTERDGFREQSQYKHTALLKLDHHFNTSHYPLQLQKWLWQSLHSVVHSKGWDLEGKLDVLEPTHGVSRHKWACM